MSERPIKTTETGYIYTRPDACIPCVAELVQLATAGEDDERHLGVAEHGELVGLLEEAVATLGEGHLAVDLVLDPLQLHPSPPHLDRAPLLSPAPQYNGMYLQLSSVGSLGVGKPGFSRWGTIEPSPT
jgi:hypothetical protein